MNLFSGNAVDLDKNQHIEFAEFQQAISQGLIRLKENFEKHPWHPSLGKVKQVLRSCQVIDPTSVNNYGNIGKLITEWEGMYKISIRKT